MAPRVDARQDDREPDRLYVPPSDGPLDPLEELVIRILAPIIAARVRAELAAEADDEQSQTVGRTR